MTNCENQNAGCRCRQVVWQGEKPGYARLCTAKRGVETSDLVYIGKTIAQAADRAQIVWLMTGGQRLQLSEMILNTVVQQDRFGIVPAAVHDTV